MTNPKARFRTTSNAGMTPNGVPDAENTLTWLNNRIVECNMAIDGAAHNGSDAPLARGALDAYKNMKQHLFGEVYNT